MGYRKSSISFHIVQAFEHLTRSNEVLGFRSIVKNPRRVLAIVDHCKFRNPDWKLVRIIDALDISLVATAVLTSLSAEA